MSNRLKNLFLLSILLFIAHGIEELITGFDRIDSQVQLLIIRPFLTFQIIIWLFLIIAYLILLGPKWQLRLMVIPGLIMIYELYHIYKALIVGGYYPGSITGLLFPVLAFFFWKELLKDYKTHV